MIPHAPRSSPKPPFTHFSHAVRNGLFWLLLSLGALFALPSLLIALLLWWRASKTWDAREWWSGIWLLAVIGSGIYGSILWVGHPFPILLHVFASGITHHVLSKSVVSFERLWELHLLLIPAFALILEGLHPLSQRIHLKPRCPAWQGGRQEDRHSLPASVPSVQVSPAPFALSSSSAIPSIAQTCTLRSSCEPLGEFLGGDLYEWVYRNELCIPREEFMRHMVVLGEPGYGKTITLLQLAAMAVRYGMQVVYLDLKGSLKTGAQFVAVMHLHGVQRIRVYPCEPYDGWRGDAKTLYNRLMQMVEPGTHPFYRKLTSSLVSLAVNAPDGPPRNSKQFLQRLDTNWLYRAYAGQTVEQSYARRKIAKLVPHIDDLSLTFEGFFDGIAGALDGTFAFEDGDAIYIGLDGDAQKEQASLMGSYLLEDCAHYAKYRKGSRHTLLVLDEFGVLESTNATDLFERVREPGMSVCASAQSYEGLGLERKKVVMASSIKFLHRCGDPEEIVKYAGEREVPAFSHLLQEGDGDRLEPAEHEQTPQGRLAVRMQRQYTMSIEEVQQLGIGKIALITGGLGAWCQVYPLAIPADLLRSALAYVSTSPVASTPLSPSSVSEPAPSKKPSRRSPSSLGQSAQKQGKGNRRGKKEFQVSQPPETSLAPSVPSNVTAPFPVSVPSPSPRLTAAAPATQQAAQVAQGNGQGTPSSVVLHSDDEDSPVDF